MLKKEITDFELLDSLKKATEDGMTMFILSGGKFRGAFLSAPRLLNQMRENHSLGILESLALGHALLSTALLIPTMKGREHVTLRYETDGKCAGFQTEADSTGYVRGFLLTNPIPVSTPPESWDLSPFFGNGFLTLSRFGEGMKEAQTGSVEIKNRNIAQDLAWYFDQSEQTKTAFSTSVQFDKKGRIIGAGGIFLQKIARTGGNKIEEETDEEDEWLTEQIEIALKKSKSIGKIIASGESAENAIQSIFKDFEPKIILSRSVIFDCPCSAEKFAQKIRALGKDELNDIFEHDTDPLEVFCHNCGSVYKIYKEMLR